MTNTPDPTIAQEILDAEATVLEAIEHLIRVRYDHNEPGVVTRAIILPVMQFTPPNRIGTGYQLIGLSEPEAHGLTRLATLQLEHDHLYGEHTYANTTDDEDEE